MIDSRDKLGHQRLEIGPGGIKIESLAPARARDAEQTTRPGSALALAWRHPRLLAAGLTSLGVAAIVGPLAVILALELPLWLLTGPGVLAAISFVGAVAVARGALDRLRQAHARPELERKLLDLALHSGGRLTVPLTAQRLAISLAEADDLLMSLARSGHVDIDNDPSSGGVIYQFRDLNPQLPLRSTPTRAR